MYQRKIILLTQSIFLATVLSSGLIVSACSAESSNTTVSSNKNTAAEIYELGLAYYEGDSVPQDYEKAFNLFKKSADQEYVEAQFNLGVMYENGVGVNQDYKKAMQSYLSAADNRDFDAQNNIGSLYYFGKGVDQNYAKALDWYTKAADQDNQQASNRIGRLVMNGKIDDTGITIYSTQETGLTLGDIEEPL
ncbi:tetratricopeptide repeat protein [Psychrobacter sp. ASPA161_9]|uniref:tetratricopeptide repeat protein n=1 Tax=Psychrobacter sp. ASPA161_9 TaxID=3160961 RepID=UPI003F7E0D44